MKKLTPAEKMRRAFERAEWAAVDLISVAERFKNESDSISTKSMRRDLLGAARRYSQSMDALTRTRK